MPKIIFLPHPIKCPNGMIVKAEKNENLLDVALYNGIYIEHYCGKCCACASCHCIIKYGFDSLKIRSEREEDILDKVFCLEQESRLSCQVKISDKDLVIEIP